MPVLDNKKFQVIWGIEIIARWMGIKFQDCISEIAISVAGITEFRETLPHFFCVKIYIAEKVPFLVLITGNVCVLE